MSEDSLELLSVLMDSPGIWKNRTRYLNENNTNNNMGNQETEEYDMCQAIRELIEDGRQEGLSQGLSQGRIETLMQNVKSLMSSLSISLEKACELLNCTKDYEILSSLIQK